MLREIAKLGVDGQCGVVGKVCIDYIDQITGKVREQVKGTNHIFPEMFFTADWMLKMQRIPLYASDYVGEFDTNLPLLLGNIVGVGMPGVGASGNYLGSYLANESIIAKTVMNKLTSKFVYEFGSQQVPSTIKYLALTQQLRNNTGTDFIDPRKYACPSIPLKTLCMQPETSIQEDCIHVGKYAYRCASGGIVSKYNMTDGTYTTINATSLVGTSATRVGYDDSTGKFYIGLHSSTASQRRIFEFADDTFSAILNTYITTNDDQPYNFYAYGGKAFNLNLYSTTKTYTNFVNNTAPQVVTLLSTPAVSELSTYSNYMKNALAYGKFLISLGSVSVSGSAWTINNGGIYDMDACAQVGVHSCAGYNVGGRVLFNPYTDIKLPMVYSTADKCYIANGASAIYKMPVDVPERPAGSGIKISYTIEVDMS